MVEISFILVKFSIPIFAITRKFRHPVKTSIKEISMGCHWEKGLFFDIQKVLHDFKIVFVIFSMKVTLNVRLYKKLLQ